MPRQDFAFSARAFSARAVSILVAVLLLSPGLVSAAEEAPAPDRPEVKLPAVQKVERVSFDAAKLFGAWSKPTVVKSEKEAAKLFGKEELAKLKKQVDFERQTLLIFAWRGSGQDKLTYEVLESFPEQVVFKRVPGRTRDLRPHVHVFALRNNVKWRAAAGR